VRFIPTTKDIDHNINIDTFQLEKKCFRRKTKSFSIFTVYEDKFTSGNKKGTSDLTGNPKMSA